MDLAIYHATARLMRPGDVIAFAGEAWTSKLIRWWYSTEKIEDETSHVALVKYGETSASDVIITESTIEDGHGGPQSHALLETLEDEYSAAGCCAWLLQLDDARYAKIDWPKFYMRIQQAESGRISYDAIGYLGFPLRRIPFIGKRICQGRQYHRMFCDAYDVAELEASGVLPPTINWSLLSPADFVRMKIFKPAIQIMGPPTVIDPLYNTVRI